MSTLLVSVPASSANLGPGFDTFALALDLRLTARIERTTEGLEIDIDGEGAGELPRDHENLMLRAMKLAFQERGQPLPGLRIRMVNAIPPAAGLGSSAAAIVAGLVAGEALLEGSFDPNHLLALAASLEGHSDNAAAALLGGLVVVSPGPSGLLTRKIPVADLRVAVAVPSMRLSTEAMRAALPTQVPLADASFNLGRAALVLEALRWSDYSLLAQALEDRLHEPHRRAFIPGYDAVASAARQAGAAAVALSGSGPSVLAFGPEGHQEIAQAMAAAFRGAGLEARPMVLAVDHRGATLESG